MTQLTIIIIGAAIDEYPDQVTSPDYPISFTCNDIGEVSIHDMAQVEGSRLWEQMHGEKPSTVYYQTK